ncbi:MAG TPA: hypothetical protein VKV26_10550 [Dehalococcoidia bacterium]|nr:hypothetical protein [Dehalococcoidia bacterium]
MIFPKEAAVYENLNTSFTIFPELIADLLTQRLTGYVQLRYPAYEGTVFLDRGVVLNAVGRPGTRVVTGVDALRDIEERAAERGGGINVYTLAPGVATMLAAIVDSEVLYRDLSSSFTSLDRLIAKLRTEGHTGYIEIAGPDGGEFGFIFLSEGEPVEGVLSANGHSQTGAAVVPSLVAAIADMEATFHVYRAVAPPATDQADTDLAAVPGMDETDAPGEPVGSAAPVAGNGWAAPLAEEAGERQELIELWQELLSRVELVVDQVGGRGAFATAFRRALVAQASRFPFLDPFAAEFEYSSGTVELHGRPEPDLSLGLGTCLRETIAGLVRQLKRTDLETQLRAALVETVARSTAAIERYDLRATLAEYLS